MGPLHRLQVPETAKGQRLDRYLADQVPSLSRSQSERLIHEQRVILEGRPARTGLRLRGGEVILVDLPDDAPTPPVPEHLPLEFVYEDERLLAVNKRAGMVVHPAVGHAGGTLVNALLASRPVLADLHHAGIVHRLDRYTSGILLIAKNEPIREALRRQFRLRQVRKTYVALVEGRVIPREGQIEAPLGRDPHHRQRMAVVSGGRPATTLYRVEEILGHHTLLEVHPQTGRTHQIRVHLSAIGHPVVGDRTYGHRRDPLGLRRHFLHALCLGFCHPTHQMWLELRAEMPPELERVLVQLRRT